MDDSRWERAAGIGGILFLVVVLVSAFLPGEPPSTSDSAREIARWFLDKGDEIRYAGFLGVIATIPLVWWGASLFRMMERANGNARLGVIAVVGLAVGAVAGCVGGVMSAAAAIDAAILGPGGVRIFFLLSVNLNAVIGVGSALVAGSLAATVLRTGVLPRWLGWLGALVAGLSVLATGVTASTRDAVFVLSFVGMLSFLVLVLAVSILMLQGRTLDEPPELSRSER